MGDSYRDEIKKTQKRHRTGFPTRSSRDSEASEARSKAIQREQSRKTFRARAKEKAIQTRMN